MKWLARFLRFLRFLLFLLVIAVLIDLVAAYVLVSFFGGSNQLGF